MRNIRYITALAIMAFSILSLYPCQDGLANGVPVTEFRSDVSDNFVQSRSAIPNLIMTVFYLAGFIIFLKSAISMLIRFFRHKKKPTKKQIIMLALAIFLFFIPAALNVLTSSISNPPSSLTFTDPSLYKN